MMGILSCRVINLFEGIKSVETSYQNVETSFLLNASHLELLVEARKFSDRFSDDVSPLFPSQMLSIKTSFREKIAHLKSAKEMASFLIAENASLATTYPDICTAYMMYMTVPVTVATAEKPIPELKLIQNFLQSFISQERPGDLAPLSTENEQVVNLDFRKVIQLFVSAKARRKNFKFPTTRK